jgi:hypothetical protein
MSKALELAASLRRMDTFTAYQREQLLFAASELTRFAAMEQAVMDAKPLFFYRPFGENGLYEGPHYATSVGGRMIREEKPEAWHGLYTLKGIKP